MSDDFDYEYDPDEDINDQQEDYELENLFFEADDIKKSNPSKSIELFENIIIVEESITSKDFKWKFKCLQNIIQLKAGLGRFEEITEDITRLAEVLNTVSRNVSNEAVFGIIECLNSAEPHLSAKIMDHLLSLLEQHQHLWMSAALRLAQNYLKIGELEKLEQLIFNFKEKCKLPTNKEVYNEKNSGNLLELFSIEIQLCSLKKDYVRMKNVSQLTNSLSSAIVDPKSLAIIKETGGKLLMLEKKWKEACNELNESFKIYQEVGNTKAKTVLKYLVLAGMLSKSEINVFYSREARVYKEDPEILAMMELRTAFEGKDLTKFELILKENKIKVDEFMNSFLEELAKIFSVEKIINLIIPYQRVKLSFLANELGESTENIIKMIHELMLEGKLNGKIDLIDESYDKPLDSFADEEKKLRGLKDWITSIKSL